MSNRTQATTLARARRHYWWRLILDGRHLHPLREGERLSTSECVIEGPLPPECWRELMTLVKRWEEEGLI